MPEPSLIVVPGQYAGYLLEELEAEMEPAELARWKEWGRGITVAVHEGKMLVYAWDWEDFKAGRPNLD